VHGLPAAPHIGIVDDVVVHERRGVDEFDDGGIQDGAGTDVAAQPRAISNTAGRTRLPPLFRR
jgi:hypothetical protein